MDWSWAIEGVNNDVPRTMGPECENYMTNKRRWIETVVVSLGCLYLLRWASKRADPINLPCSRKLNQPHTTGRLFLMLLMTFVFGIEMGFKFANKSVIFVLNPCHIQTLVQIYLLAAKPSKATVALFRIQMNNLNGPLLAFIFPEVESRTLPFEQATYWLQHALLYIIPVYIIRTGIYEVEDIYDFNWVTIGIMIMLLYHFVILNAVSIASGVNLNHMLCAAVTDPFEGQNYRIAAVIHESILCPILNKVTVLLYSNKQTMKSNLLRKHNYTQKISTIINDNNLSKDELLYHQHYELTETPTTTTKMTSSQQQQQQQQQHLPPINVIQKSIPKQRKNNVSEDNDIDIRIEEKKHHQPNKLLDDTENLKEFLKNSSTTPEYKMFVTKKFD
uniref:Transmembrane protein 164 n=1 Tax=Glossina brevipalpis TaxID=37001 RepID=A0A1A9WIH2_9MUSC